MKPKSLSGQILTGGIDIMFNLIKKTGEPKPINRLGSLKRGDEEAKKEESLSPQPNKSSAAFSKALNAVRKEVVESAQPSAVADVNKPSKIAVSFGDAINARREKTINPYIKISPQFQAESSAHAATHAESE